MRFRLLAAIAVTIHFLLPDHLQAAPQVQLTPEESAWLEKHPKLRLGVDPAWPPFSFIGKDGRHQGIDAEILQIIAERVGFKLVLVPTETWSETVAVALDHRLELVPGTALTEERRQYANFTEPYVSTPVAVVMRSDAPFYVGLESLIGRRVAAPREYVTTRFLQRAYPELTLVPTATLGQALELVAKGDADAVVANLVVLSHLIKVQGLRNLKIVGLTKERFDLRIAVAKEHPELLSILNKALATISEREQFAIIDRWISVDVEEVLYWPLLRKYGTWALLVSGGIFGAGLIWNRRLSEELAERRKAEAALIDKEEKLRAANARLQTLSDDRRMLMNMVAHDLNSPLTALTLGVSFVRTQIDPGAAVHRDLDNMDSATERMMRLVTNLLSADAIEQGNRQLKALPVPLGSIASKVVERFRRTAETKQIALTLSDRCAPETMVTGDATALEQVVENLVSNALKFTPHGGTVAVDLEQRGGQLRLSVRDTGPGVPEQDRSRLFRKFQRLTAQPTGGESSNGLGLAIARMLAVAMKGDLAYEDAEGGGAKFLLTLPVAG